MPYIKQEERAQIDGKLNDLLMHMGPLTPGQFVYIVYKLSLWLATDGGSGNVPTNWSKCNEVIGGLDSASKEFYRRVVAPYEEEAILKNGDCISPMGDKNNVTWVEDY